LIQAIQILGKSIARFPRVDYRYVSYVEWVIKRADTKPSTSQSMLAQTAGTANEAQPAAPGQSSASSESIPTLLENARAAALKLQKHAISEKLKERGAELAKEVEDRLTKIPPKKADEEEDTVMSDLPNSDSAPV
jgi:hypothetical protein